MRSRNIMCFTAIVTGLLAGPVLGQSAGGQSGYDGSLAAIEPTNEPVRSGLAGDDPADIGRYLLAANGGIGGARLAPGGNQVAFQWAVSGEPQLWLADVDAGRPRRLTYGNGITFFEWAPDGSGILFGADNSGDEQEAYFFINAEGTKERLVMPAASGGFRIFGDFVSATEIVFASTERNGLDFDIYLADLTTGTSRLVVEGTYGFFARDVSPDGRYVVIGEQVGEDSNNLCSDTCLVCKSGRGPDC